MLSLVKAKFLIQRMQLVLWVFVSPLVVIQGQNQCKQLSLCIPSCSWTPQTGLCFGSAPAGFATEQLFLSAELPLSRGTSACSRPVSHQEPVDICSVHQLSALLSFGHCLCFLTEGRDMKCVRSHPHYISASCRALISDSTLQPQALGLWSESWGC